MQVKVTLKVGAYMFSEGFSLSRGTQQILETDSLSYTDLFLIASKIQSEQLESSVSADEILTIAEKKKPQEVQEKQEISFESQEEGSIEVVEVEQEQEEVAEEQVEEKGQEDFIKLIVDQIEAAPTGIAVKSVRNFAEEGYSKEFFELALVNEEAGKNRPSVIKEIKKNL